MFLIFDLKVTWNTHVTANNAKCWIISKVKSFILFSTRIYSSQRNWQKTFLWTRLKSCQKTYIQWRSSSFFLKSLRYLVDKITSKSPVQGPHIQSLRTHKNVLKTDLTRKEIGPPRKPPFTCTMRMSVKTCLCTDIHLDFSVRTHRSRFFVYAKIW